MWNFNNRIQELWDTITPIKAKISNNDYELRRLISGLQFQIDIPKPKIGEKVQGGTVVQAQLSYEDYPPYRGWNYIVTIYNEKENTSTIKYIHKP